MYNYLISFIAAGCTKKAEPIVTPTPIPSAPAKTEAPVKTRAKILFSLYR